MQVFIIYMLCTALIIKIFSTSNCEFVAPFPVRSFRFFCKKTTAHISGLIHYTRAKQNVNFYAYRINLRKLRSYKSWFLLTFAHLKIIKETP